MGHHSAAPTPHGSTQETRDLLGPLASLCPLKAFLSFLPLAGHKKMQGVLFFSVSSFRESAQVFCSQAPLPFVEFHSHLLSGPSLVDVNCFQGLSSIQFSFLLFIWSRGSLSHWGMEDTQLRSGVPLICSL